jgi:hypothetical protein
MKKAHAICVASSALLGASRIRDMRSPPGHACPPLSILYSSTAVPSAHGDPVGEAARHEIRHHAAVRETRREDAAPVDRMGALQRVEQRAHECGFIDVRRLRVAATAARVPREQPLLAESPAPRGVHDDRADAGAERRESGLHPCARRRAAAAVKVQHERQRAARRVARRKVYQIAAIAPADLEMTFDGCCLARRECPGQGENQRGERAAHFT